MKALQFSATGSLDHLKLVDVPVPTPRAGEVLVRVEAAGLNPSDVKNVLGRFPYTTLPRIPGRDFAGEVVEGPSNFIGKKVFGSGKELGFFADGTHAEYVVVPQSGAAVIPQTLSVAQAGGVGVPYVTAWEALERAQAGAGVRTLIIGVGAVGRAAADLAKWRGADLVLAVRRADQALALEAAGFTAEILSDAPFAELLPPRFHGAADVVFDTTGAWTAESVAALAPMGRLAIIAAPASGTVEFPTLALYRKGGTLVGVNSLLHDTRASAAMLAAIARGWAAGNLALPPEPRVWPLADGLAAYRTVDAGSAEKIVLSGSA